MKVANQKFNTVMNIKNIKIFLGLLGLLIFLLVFTAFRDTDSLISHKHANSLYSRDAITKVIVDGEFIRLETEKKNYKIYKDAINKEAFFSKYPVELKESNLIIFMGLILLVALGIFWFIYLLVRVNKLQAYQKVRLLHKETKEDNDISVEALNSDITFDNIAGMKDVKEELEEIIDFLRYPKKYHALDIHLPKGVLFVGPPGVGKTLISKAVAGEAGVPFFYQSGASFVHIYVGMGAKRVSELFKKAKQMAPSIIFIDEIDAVGKSRGELRNDEREATLNQLLTEMDGFEENSDVIVIGATNKIDVLDDALLRSGRFDRRIHISLPDLIDRTKTLELYLTNKSHNVDIDTIARMTVGFNFAALNTLTNEAALHAMRTEHKEISTSDFELVKDKVVLGKRKILSFTEKEREIQAIYQGAKAVVATWLEIEYEKIGIINTTLVSQDYEILSRSELMNKIKFYLSGSIATKIHYNEQFSNAINDIHQAKEIAYTIIHEYVMSKHFTASTKDEEALIKEATLEITTLLGSLENARREISNYLLAHENITQEKCKELLREIF